MRTIEWPGLVRSLLDIPGADRVMLTWVDPESERLCVTDLTRSDADQSPALPTGADENYLKDVYLIGKFPLGDDGVEGEISHSLNDLRKERGLPPLPIGMFTRLPVSTAEAWEGVVRVGPAAALMA
jgi:hypothetical protein